MYIVIKGVLLRISCFCSIPLENNVKLDMENVHNTLK